AARPGGEEIVRITDELILKVDRRAAEHHLAAALLREPGDVEEDGARIVGGCGECAAHGHRFCALLEQREAGAERGAGDHEHRQGDQESTQNEPPKYFDLRGKDRLETARMIAFLHET